MDHWRLNYEILLYEPCNKAHIWYVGTFCWYASAEGHNYNYDITGEFFYLLTDLVFWCSLDPETLKRVTTMDKEQVEEDIDLLETIQDLTNKLNCNHNVCYFLFLLGFNPSLHNAAFWCTKDI